jgi:hypothetical protein
LSHMGLWITLLFRDPELQPLNKQLLYSHGYP